MWERGLWLCLSLPLGHKAYATKTVAPHNPNKPPSSAVPFCSLHQQTLPFPLSHSCYPASPPRESRGGLHHLSHSNRLFRRLISFTIHPSTSETKPHGPHASRLSPVDLKPSCSCSHPYPQAALYSTPATFIASSVLSCEHPLSWPTRMKSPAP